MALDTITLENSLLSLKKVLAMEENDVVRDSAIQRFEYTYELAIKFIKKQIKEMSAEAVEVNALHFKELLRTAADKGLIEDPVIWFKYRDMRNMTSHTYDEKKSQQIYLLLPGFAKSAEYLLGNIKRLNQ